MEICYENIIYCTTKIRISEIVKNFGLWSFMADTDGRHHNAYE